MFNKNIYNYFGSKKERVFRVLLSNKYKNLSSYKVAKLSETNYSWVHSIFKELEREGILKNNKMVDVRKMFFLWAKHPYANQQYWPFFREYNIQNPKEVLKNAKMEYAFTGYFAENLIGNYLFPRYYEMYINDYDLEKWHNYLSNSGYSGKGNVRIYCYDQHVFFEKRDVEGWPVVSIQQLIVDLIREGAECGEAGERLMKMIYHA
jgi:hypothetical protein